MQGKRGDAGGAFPATRWSAIVAARSEDSQERRQAFELIVTAYWKPVYRYIRLKWHKDSEEAQDLTQGFFTEAIEKNFFQRYDPRKARFRTFLRTCLEAFLANEEKAARRIKRGGGARILSIDFQRAEDGLKAFELPASESPEEYFHKEWVRNLFALAIEDLRKICETAGKSAHFRIFEEYDLEISDSEKRPTYEDLAAKFHLSSMQVTNYLAYARREFRRIVLEKLREITGTEEEFRSEARSLLGIEVS